MIDGLRDFLESIETWEEIKSIIPGRIKPIDKSHVLRIKVQYQTTDGLKCLALSGNAVQEVFIVSSEPMLLWDRLESL